MFKVNLLPWREQYKRSRQNAFYKTLAVCFAIGLAAGGAYYFYTEKMLKDANERLVSVQAQKKKLDAELAKYKALQELEIELEAKLAALRLLEEQRFLMAERLDKLPALMNGGVMLDTISSDETGMTATGIGLDEFSVSSFMRTLDSSTVFGGSSIGVLSQESRSRETVLPGQSASVDVLRFDLSVQNKFGEQSGQGG